MPARRPTPRILTPAVRQAVYAQHRARRAMQQQPVASIPAPRPVSPGPTPPPPAAAAPRSGGVFEIPPAVAAALVSKTGWDGDPVKAYHYLRLVLGRVEGRIEAVVELAQALPPRKVHKRNELGRELIGLVAQAIELRQILNA